MNRINKNILSNVLVKCKRCPDMSVKISDLVSHRNSCQTQAIKIDKCIFAEEEEKKAHAKDLSLDEWKSHVASDCNGKALLCPNCKINIYRLY